MSWQRSLLAAVRALKREETDLEKQLDVVRSKIRELGDLGRSSGLKTNARRKTGSRRLSPQGRAAISRAAKKRWAEYRRTKRRRS